MADADKTPAKEKKKSPLPMIAIAVVLLGAGGGGGWWFFVHKPAVEAAAAAEEAANDDQDHGEHGAEGKATKHGKSKKDKKKDKKKGEAEPQGIVTFDPFVVNLADKGATRFLRANVRLVVGGAEEAEKLQKDQVIISKLRSAILDLLSEQTADQMVTADGKSALKQAIAERASETLDEVEVSDVLFADFVVQF